MSAFPTSRLSRRLFLGTGLAAAAAFGVTPVQALTADQAKGLVDKVVADVNRIIGSGKGEGAMLSDFEALFARHADVPAIARGALGTAARTATPAQLTGFTKAYQRYISRKYGRRFREFVGGRIEVQGARAVKSYVEVMSTAHLKGSSPFELRWHVSDKGGRPLFFNLVIEGVNMLASERTEIGAMLDKRKGNLDQLIADLGKM